MGKIPMIGQLMRVVYLCERKGRAPIFRSLGNPAGRRTLHNQCPRCRRVDESLPSVNRNHRRWCDEAVDLEVFAQYIGDADPDPVVQFLDSRGFCVLQGGLNDA